VEAVNMEDVHTKYYFNMQHAKLKMADENTEKEIKAKKPKKGQGLPKQKPPVVYDSVGMPIPVSDSTIKAFNDSLQNEALVKDKKSKKGWGVSKKDKEKVKDKQSEPALTDSSGAPIVSDSLQTAGSDSALIPEKGEKTKKSKKGWGVSKKEKEKVKDKAKDKVEDKQSQPASIDSTGTTIPPPIELPVKKDSFQLPVIDSTLLPVIDTTRKTGNK
jgi:hypothetical protein